MSADCTGQVVNTFQVQGNVKTTLPPRRCWSRAKSATYARRYRVFSFRITNAKVVGLHDPPIMLATVIDLRLWQVCPVVHDVLCIHALRQRCTDPPDSSHVQQAAPNPHDSPDMFFEHAVPHCLDSAMDPLDRCPHTEKSSEVHQPQESHASKGPSKTSLPPSTHGDTSSLPSSQFCPPRFYHSLELGKFLERGSGSLSPFCEVPSLQTCEIPSFPSPNVRPQKLSPGRTDIRATSAGIDGFL